MAAGRFEGCPRTMCAYLAVMEEGEGEGEGDVVGEVEVEAAEDEEPERSPSRRVKTSSQRSMAASQDLRCGLVPVIGRQLRGISWLSVVGE
jgi:hypothetical protein